MKKSLIAATFAAALASGANAQEATTHLCTVVNNASVTFFDETIAVCPSDNNGTIVGYGTATDKNGNNRPAVIYTTAPQQMAMS